MEDAEDQNTREDDLSQDVAPTPKYLFFDTETNGINTLIQLAWEITDADGNLLSSASLMVQGATYMSRFVPHTITVEDLDDYGLPPTDVLRTFLEALRCLVDAGGVAIAHNAKFDFRVLRTAILAASEMQSFARPCVALHESSIDTLRRAESSSVCTMVLTKHFCGLTYTTRKGRKVLKAPKLSELYVILFGTAPTEKLHDALGDVRTLRKAYMEYLARVTSERLMENLRKGNNN
jgi:DNA polymerase III epsilon subunit-like protein